MFGYVVVNKQDLKIREFDLYQSYYCGFCRELKHRFGARGQLTLSYDLTFLILLLTSLYESETVEGSCKCVAHPVHRHPTRSNEMTGYAADMNLLLSYYKCEDDWQDERKLGRRAFGGLLKRQAEEVARRWPVKAERISGQLAEIRRREVDFDGNIDGVAGCFGELTAEVFAMCQDAWERDLRQMGFFLGKFIYLMDAWEDLEKDRKSGSFNPFLQKSEEEGFEEYCEQVLTMMMAECCKAFERLPLLLNVEILRNILYSGVWCRHEQLKEKKRQEEENQKHV